MNYYLNYTTNGLSEFYRDPRFSGFRGQGETIAVIDSGIDLDHRGFGQDRNRDGISDRILRGDLDFTTSRDNSSNDHLGHGTSVAGIAATMAKESGILPLQVQNKGLANTDNFIDAINWAVENRDRYNIRVLTISYSDAENHQSNFQDGGYEDCMESSYRAIRRAESAGITVVGAAGNYYDYYNRPGFGFFAAIESTIGAMATSSNGMTETESLWNKSQRRGDGLAAPGQAIATYGLNGRITKGTGTSFATPFISGAVALLQDVSEHYLDRYLAPSEVRTILTETADSLTATAGYKEIDIYAAAEKIYTMAFPNNPSQRVSTASIIPWATNIYQSRSATVQAEDNLLSITGRKGVGVAVSGTINSDTVLKFEYRSTTNTGVNGIGLDDNNIFRLHGTGDQFISLNGENNARLGLVDDHVYTGLNTWQQFNISVGDMFEGSFDKVTFFNATGTSEFRNIQIVN